MDEKESMLKVAEKIKELQAVAKKKKNMLEYQEVLDYLRDTELGKEEIEKICDFLEQHGVDILRVTEETDADAIVVSEETGRISFVSGGQVTPITNINELKLHLTTSLSK